MSSGHSIHSSAYSGILLKKIHVADLSDVYGAGHRGLITDEKIFKGEIILENDPRTSMFYPLDDPRGIYTLEEFHRLVNEQCHSDVKTSLRRYSLQYDHNHVIVPQKYLRGEMIDLCVFLNHSCEGNCTQIDVFRIAALRDIEIGSMLTTDYGLYNTDDMQLLPFDHCLCGTKTCAGDQVFQRYKGRHWQDQFYEHCSPYVKAKIDQIRKEQTK